MKIKKYNPLAGMATGEYAYSVLRKNIIRMHIEPGEKLSEQEISNILGVSRTPVRESFIKLGKEGAVYVLPQRGTYVAKINMRQVEEARFIRRNLEKAIFVESLSILTKTDLEKMEKNLEEQRAIIALNGELTSDDYADFLEKEDAFHKLPYIATGRERTWDFIEGINLNYQRVRLISFALEHKLDDIYMEHLKIMEALKSKNAKELSDIIEKHISNLELEKSKVTALFPDYFE